MRFECFRRKRAIWRRTIPLSHSLEEDGLKAAVMGQNWVLASTSLDKNSKLRRHVHRRSSRFHLLQRPNHLRFAVLSPT